MYWRASTLRASTRQAALRYVASDQLTRAGVRAGDVLWPVTSPRRGALTLVGRLSVREVTSSRAVAEAALGESDLWQADGYTLDPTSQAPIDPTDISSLALDLRFNGRPTQLPPNFSGQHLQSLRQLDDRSAERLEGVWAARAHKGALNLQLHGRYTRQQIFATFGVAYSSRQQHLNTGLSPRNPDGGYCIFITLNKEEMQEAYAYEDDLYADRFLWMTRRDRTADHPDYVALRVDSTRVSLFARAAPGDKFAYLGELGYIKHKQFMSNGRPQQKYIFALREPIPQNLLAALHSGAPPSKRASHPQPITRRRPTDLDGQKKAFSYALDRLDRQVNPAHHNYQVRLKAFLEIHGVTAEWERDYVDVTFLCGNRRYIGEIKVTGYLNPEEAFRTALGQLLVYGHLRFEQCPDLVMFLDHRPVDQLLHVATRYGISVVAEQDGHYEVLNPAGTQPALVRLFHSAEPDALLERLA